MATRTTSAPRTKAIVIRKLNNATDTRKEITMLKLVAKPFKILSAYLMTSAVSRPPRTCVSTVAHAQTPKLAKRLVLNHPDVVTSEGELVKMTGTSAGRSEKSESWTFRTHKSPEEPFKTNSK